MLDLYVGIVIVGILSLLIFAVSWRMALHQSPRRISATTCILLLLLFVYICFLQESILGLRLVPFSNAIVLLNLFPPILGVLAGLFLAYPRHPKTHKIVAVSLISILAVWSMYSPFTGSKPEGGDHWRGDLCMQSNTSSCSAASAATLLEHFGIQADENQMIDLCLTREAGTHQFGIFRGLKIKTKNTPWQVGVISGNVDDLRKNRNWPVILQAGIDKDYECDPRYESEFGWIPGQPHSVVMFGFAANGRAKIGDPSIGFEQWSDEDLETLFQGTAFYLYRETPNLTSRAD